ncbi:MAG: putative porin, partial [Steroidobacteraceae bacterium]
MTVCALCLLLIAPGGALAATSEQDRAEIAELKRQVAVLPMLLARIEQLEQSNAALQSQRQPADAGLENRVAAVERANDLQTDRIAQGLASANDMAWARNIKWKGDLRYRNESFDIDGTTSNRVRDRLRVRFGLEAKVSPTLLVGVEVATGEGRDARSTNSTLDSANQHEEIGLDLA